VGGDLSVGARRFFYFVVVCLWLAMFVVAIGLENMFAAYESVAAASLSR
jgi:hypothetical protein